MIYQNYTLALKNCEKMAQVQLGSEKLVDKMSTCKINLQLRFGGETIQQLCFPTI